MRGTTRRDATRRLQLIYSLWHKSILNLYTFSLMYLGSWVCLNAIISGATGWNWINVFLCSIVQAPRKAISSRGGCILVVALVAPEWQRVASCWLVLRIAVEGRCNSLCLTECPVMSHRRRGSIVSPADTNLLSEENISLFNRQHPSANYYPYIFPISHVVRLKLAWHKVSN